jgi:catechol 2,3-dioxygenase-like lactoylglutathione lyase family enzyme
MFDHVGIQVDDLGASRKFYTALLAPLGLKLLVDVGPAVGYGPAGGQAGFWIGTASEVPHREVHIAFTAADRAAVEAVHAIAVEHGVEVLHGPRVFPEYHPHYYGVYVRDLDGNNVETVCHRPAE